MPGTLYIVSTPIGNLEDITLRAIDTLKRVNLIACEDTRRTKILLDRHAIRTPTTSFYHYNRIRKGEHLISRLERNEDIALVSDAGTPGISDPAYSIIRRALESGVPIEAIPGPTAFVAALVVSGKPTNRFAFEGFLPAKSGPRRNRLRRLKDERRTIILYESPHRLVRLLEDIYQIYGDVEIVCARELTKKFEEVKREKAGALLEHFKAVKARGEFIVII